MGSLRNVPVARFRSTREMDAADLLLDCLRTGEPVVVLTGAAGLGKTTVLKIALEQLNGPAPRILRLEPPFPTPLELQLSLARLLNLPEAGSAAPAELARALRALPASDDGAASITVIVDGAEAVPLPLLQYLWLMHTVAGVEKPSLQLILIGREALWRQLGEEKLAGLRRGVAARLAVQPFPADEAVEFLDYLLRVRRRRADPDAIEAMLSTAAGVPGRLVTLLEVAEAGLPTRRAITLGRVQAVSCAPPAAPKLPAASAPSSKRRPSRLLPVPKLRPLQFAMALAGLVLMAAAWQLLAGISVSPGEGNRPDNKPLAVVAQSIPSPVPAPPFAKPTPIAMRAPHPDVAPSIAWRMPDPGSAETAAASLLAISSREGSLVGGLIQSADASLSDLVRPSFTAGETQTKAAHTTLVDRQADLADRLHDITQQVPCSLMSAAVSNPSVVSIGGVTALGEASEMEIRGSIEQSIARALPAATVVWKVARIAGPHCAILDLLRPNATRRGTTPSIVPVPHGASGSSTPPSVGPFQVRMPAFPASLVVDAYFGNYRVRHLLPGSGTSARSMSANAAVPIVWPLEAQGGKSDGNSLKPTLFVVLASPAPLLDAPRPPEEATADYLKVLEKAITRPGAAVGADAAGAAPTVLK